MVASLQSPLAMPPYRVFLLSPANCGGKRAGLLFRESAAFDLARRLRAGAVPIGEVFTFVSGLYFRGKLAYASAFGYAPDGVPPALIITSNRGLVPPDEPMTLDDLAACGSVPVDLADVRYRRALEASAIYLATMLPEDCPVVLLGSIASGKYYDLLVDVLEPRLAYPAEFIGRGDMSRGALMLEVARRGQELTYIPARGGPRRGPRAPGVDTPSATRARARRSAARARREEIP